MSLTQVAPLRQQRSYSQSRADSDYSECDRCQSGSHRDANNNSQALRSANPNHRGGKPQWWKKPQYEENNSSNDLKSQKSTSKLNPQSSQLSQTSQKWDEGIDAASKPQSSNSAYQGITNFQTQQRELLGVALTLGATQSIIDDGPHAQQAVDALPHERRPIQERVIADGYPVNFALIYTGASRSIISRAVFEDMASTCIATGRGKPWLFHMAQPMQLNGIGGIVATSEWVMPELEFCGAMVRHPLLVVDDLPCKLIIGLDVFVPHHAVIATADRFGINMQLRSSHICEDCRRLNDEEVRVKSDIEVPVIPTHNEKSNTSHLLTLIPPLSAKTEQFAAPTSAAECDVNYVKALPLLDTPCGVMLSLVPVRTGLLKELAYNLDPREERELLLEAQASRVKPKLECAQVVLCSVEFTQGAALYAVQRVSGQNACDYRHLLTFVLSGAPYMPSIRQHVATVQSPPKPPGVPTPSHRTPSKGTKKAAGSGDKSPWPFQLSGSGPFRAPPAPEQFQPAEPVAPQLEGAKAKETMEREVCRSSREGGNLAEPDERGESQGESRT